jgi:DNA polymerase-3 subunit gamma/tau
MSLARASINAALEAARAASGRPSAPKRPVPDAAADATGGEPGPSGAAPAVSAAPPAPAAVQAPAPARPAAAAPWDASPAQAGARAQAPAPAHPQPAMAQPQAYAQDNAQAVAEDEVPEWVTGFSDDTAVARSAAPAEAPAAVSAPPQRAVAPSAPPHAYVITPVPEINWDGNWPALAASLPLRGVSQQLAFQTELIDCTLNGGAVTFRLRVPVDTLRASGNSEKLCAAVQECFPSVRVNIDTEIGPVWYTASAEAKARRERLQHEAEQTVAADPFVRALEDTFDAFVVPGSVRPIAS